MSSNFSDNEQRLLDIIGDSQMSISEITDEYYGDNVPFDANNKVASMLRRIGRKCTHFDEPFRLLGEGSGRAGRTVWISPV